MQIERVGSGDEPAQKDLRLVLLLVVLGLFGLLMWTGLFFAFEWSLSAIWAAVTGG